jgi:hypothetical protein
VQQAVRFACNSDNRIKKQPLRVNIPALTGDDDTFRARVTVPRRFFRAGFPRRLSFIHNRPDGHDRLTGLLKLKSKMNKDLIAMLNAMLDF